MKNCASGGKQESCEDLLMLRGRSAGRLKQIKTWQTIIYFHGSFPGVWRLSLKFLASPVTCMTITQEAVARLSLPPLLHDSGWDRPKPPPCTAPPVSPLLRLGALPGIVGLPCLTLRAA